MKELFRDRILPVLGCLSMLAFAYHCGNPGPISDQTEPGYVFKWGFMMMGFMSFFGWCVGHMAFNAARQGDPRDGAMLMAYLSGSAAMIQPLQYLAS